MYHTSWMLPDPNWKSLMTTSRNICSTKGPTCQVWSKNLMRKHSNLFMLNDYRSLLVHGNLWYLLKQGIISHIFGSAKWDEIRNAANFIMQTLATFGVHKALTQANRAVTSTYNKIQQAETNVVQIENQLGVDVWWTLNHPDYQTTVASLIHQSYHQALDQLVVQRLFELSKLNMSRTGEIYSELSITIGVLKQSAGYKLRMHIAKALQRRADAIWTALANYNQSAKKVSRPTLTWAEIVEYTFLGEFDLLRNSRTDIRKEPWADPVQREATVKYLQVRQAYMEIEWLNVEVSCLRTAIHDESIHMENTLSELITENPVLCHELHHPWKVRSMVNTLHNWHLDWIERLDGFSGKHGIGVRLGRGGSEDPHYSAQTVDVVDESVLPVVEDEEEMILNFNSFTDFELSIIE